MVLWGAKFRDLTRRIEFSWIKIKGSVVYLYIYYIE
jgi:hypothetical protein